MNYRTKDRLAIVGGILMLLLIAAVLAGSVYLHFFAPCEYVDWMPTKDIPNRCLGVNVR